jgi:hypothetical protein
LTNKNGCNGERICFCACISAHTSAIGNGTHGGALRDTQVFPWEEFQKHKLHPIHFTELSAAFFYAASLLNRTPKFMIIEGEPSQVVQNPLQGFSMKPIFDDWDQETFATILARMLGLPLVCATSLLLFQLSGNVPKRERDCHAFTNVAHESRGLLSFAATL